MYMYIYMYIYILFIEDRSQLEAALQAVQGTLCNPAVLKLVLVTDHVNRTLKSDSCGIMTSSSVNIFRVTGTLCRESTGHRWIPLAKAIAEQTVKQTDESPMVQDTIVSIMTSL